MTEPRPNSGPPEPLEELDSGRAAAEADDAGAEATAPSADDGGRPGGRAVPPAHAGQPSTPATRRAGDTRGRASAQAASTAPSGSAEAAGAGEPLTYVDDPVSRIWVAIVVGAFIVVFLYAGLLSHGGILGPKSTSVPLHSVAPAVTMSAATAAASGAAASPVASSAPSSSGAASPAASGGATASPATSSGVTASPAASPATPTPTPS